MVQNLHEGFPLDSVMAVPFFAPLHQVGIFHGKSILPSESSWVQGLCIFSNANLQWESGIAIKKHVETGALTILLKVCCITVWNNNDRDRWYRQCVNVLWADRFSEVRNSFLTFSVGFCFFSLYGVSIWLFRSLPVSLWKHWISRSWNWSSELQLCFLFSVGEKKWIIGTTDASTDFYFYFFGCIKF